MKNDNRMTIPQIAKELGCSVSSIYQWRHYGRYMDLLPMKKGLNGKVYALREDVMKFKEIWKYGGHEAAKEAALQ